MLKILKIFIRKENRRVRQLEIEKMRELVKYNFKLNVRSLGEKEIEHVETKSPRERIRSI